MHASTYMSLQRMCHTCALQSFVLISTRQLRLRSRNLDGEGILHYFARVVHPPST